MDVHDRSDEAFWSAHTTQSFPQPGPRKPIMGFAHVQAELNSASERRAEAAVSPTEDTTPMVLKP